jgi:Cu+-exporting ATPase
MASGGRWLEAYSKAHTADAITSLGKLRPTEALLLTPESPTDQKYVSKDTDVEKGGPSAESGHIYTLRLGLQMVSVDLLEIGDIVRVRNGSTPPADGEIVQGKGGAFDESALTGESRLIKKQRGDLVFVGTYNRGNPVDVQITAIEGETM